jgi:hypothetical protein
MRQLHLLTYYKTFQCRNRINDIPRTTHYVLRTILHTSEFYDG